ncbi:MAG: PhoH family protein [Prevotellaceae bacterium]|jgi:phosphate starvation-inducible PhoH-like protein|nr:PhoH family protein [Prevotellaceae bacterium]
MVDRLIELPENIDATIFYGINNVNVRLLTNLYPNIKIIVRGHVVRISGTKEDTTHFADVLKQLIDFCMQQNSLTEEQILNIVSGEQPEEAAHNHLILYGVGGKPIVARTVNQQKLVVAFEKHDLLFAIGPAGSGKTYTAIALAVRSLKNKEVKKIILSRPAVEAGEKLGFLPGDMKEKIDPYLQPLYDALQDMIPVARLQEYIANGVIQIAPLAFMRGRTLNDAVIILDEAQNTSVQQIKMFLTRLGIHSKMIVTGDITQIDLPASQTSGLNDALQVLKPVKGIANITFDRRDIVRHRLVQHIVEAYEQGNNAGKKPV